MSDNGKPSLPFFLSERDFYQMVGFWHSQRRILVSGEMNMGSLHRTTLELLKLDFMSAEPITLMIESRGGSVSSTHQLEDAIQSLNSPVDAIAIGDCASMAVDLLQMCRRRMMMPSARILVHYVRSEQQWICDDLDQLENDIRYFRQRTRRIAERRLALYTRRTGLPEERLKEIFRHGEVHGAHFSAKQALELNLIDEIVQDFKIFPRQ